MGGTAKRLTSQPWQHDGSVGGTTAPTLDRRRRQRDYVGTAERFRTAFAASPVCLGLLLPDGRLFHANAALCDLLEVEEHEISGRSIVRCVALPDRPIVDALLEGTLAAQDCDLVRAGTRLVRSDGRIAVVDLAAGLVRARDGTPLLIQLHVEDRTDLHELRAEVAQLEQLGRLGHEAAEVVHDFRNLLAVMGAHLELLHNDLADSPHTGQIERVEAAVDRATNLAERLLDNARITNGSHTDGSAPDEPSEVVDLVEVVQSVADAYASPTRGHTGVTAAVHGVGTSLLSAPAIDVERVVLNLVSNACDAVDDGGTVALTVYPAVNGDNVRLTVVDDGRGMDGATLERACDPFFTTKGRAGMGLGLSGAIATLRRYQGSIAIRSQPGDGTTVTVELPPAGRVATPPPET